MSHVFDYEGPLTHGKRFRHTCFDIRCEVEENLGMRVVVRSIDTLGNKAPETMTLQTSQFRRSWMVMLPERV